LKRWYSQALLKYREDDGGDVLRVPATNIESVVINQLKQLLRDAQVLGQAAKSLEIQGERLEHVMIVAGKLANKWDTLKRSKRIDFLNLVLSKVVLTRDTIKSHFNPGPLIEYFTQGKGTYGPEGPDEISRLVMTTSVRLKRCGVETRLIIGNADEPTAHADSVKAIRNALKNAIRWNQTLLEGNARTLTGLAEKEKYDARYLFDLIQLAYLAPDIQNAIIRGRIPGDLTLDKMKKRLPVSWDSQRQILRFT
jgi:hypothetical protein